VLLHPGVLSGLALAGSNDLAEPRQGSGLLTAFEMQTWDMTGVELAVLSACGTRRGDPLHGEGSLGLDRALLAAGAESTITTLWNVDDRATCMLMERFYQNLWERRLTKLQALREAQLWMLNEGANSNAGARGLKLLDEQTPDNATRRIPPYYWAPFVLTGKWR
jgi:CHAT domain-containing protein